MKATITAHHLWMTTEDAEKDVFSFCKPVAKVYPQVAYLEVQLYSIYATLRHLDVCAVILENSSFLDGVVFRCPDACPDSLLDSRGSNSPYKSGGGWIIQILFWYVNLDTMCTSKLKMFRQRLCTPSCSIKGTSGSCGRLLHARLVHCSCNWRFRTWNETGMDQ